MNVNEIFTAFIIQNIIDKHQKNKKKTRGYETVHHLESFACRLSLPMFTLGGRELS